jgi:hypothetical protein
MRLNMTGISEMGVLEKAEQKKVKFLTVREAIITIVNVQSKLTTRRIDIEYERVIRRRDERNATKTYTIN